VNRKVLATTASLVPKAKRETEENEMEREKVGEHLEISKPKMLPHFHLPPKSAPPNLPSQSS